MHETHDRLFKLVISHTLLDKERVINLSLFHEHVDHHFHFVSASLCSLLHGGLLLDLLHLHGLRGLEGLQGLLLAQTLLLFFSGTGSTSHFSWQFSLLGGHEHLGHLRLLSHRLHRSLEFLLAHLGEDLHGLSENDLAHLVLSHELLLDDSTVTGPVLVLVVFTSFGDGSHAFVVTSLAASDGHEVEHLAHVLWVEVGAVSLDLFEACLLKFGHDTLGRIIILSVTTDVVV